MAKATDADTATDTQRLAYAVSHDLGAPVRHIRQYLGLVRSKLTDLDDRSEQHMDRIAAAADLLAARLGDVLRFSQVETRGKPAALTDANRAFESALRMLRRGVEDSGAELTTEGLGDVYADATQLSELLRELLDNAIKFRRPDRAPKVRVSCSGNADGWRFEITDDGIGIPAHVGRELFDLWRMLEPPGAYAGRGVGLTIAELIVRRHGGSIGVVSTRDEGTTVWFELPAAPP